MCEGGLYSGSAEGPGKQRRESTGLGVRPRVHQGLHLWNSVALDMGVHLWEPQFSHQKNRLDIRRED